MNWIFTQQGGYDEPEAVGPFPSREEALAAAHYNEFGEWFELSNDPDEYQTIEDWYLDADHTWVMRLRVPTNAPAHP